MSMSLQGQCHFPRSNDSDMGDHHVGDYANISSSVCIRPIIITTTTTTTIEVVVESPFYDDELLIWCE